MSNIHPLGQPARLRGRMPFTSERSMRGYRLNKFLAALISDAERNAFADAPEESMARWELSDDERDMVRRRDFVALLDYGACLLALGTAFRAFRVSLVDFGVVARGQTSAEFIAGKRAEAKGKPWQF